MPNDNQNQPTSDATQPSPIVFSEDSVPPIIGVGSTPAVTANAIPEQPKQDIDTTSPTPIGVPSTGSASPTNDIVTDTVMPAVVTSGSPKKKFAGGKIIATILGLFLLVGGVGAGVYLTQQNQNIAEKADCSGGLNPDGSLNDTCQGPVTLDNPPTLINGQSAECENGVCNVYDSGGELVGEYRLSGGGIDRCEDKPGNYWVCIPGGTTYSGCVCCPPGSPAVLADIFVVENEKSGAESCDFGNIKLSSEEIGFREVCEPDEGPGNHCTERRIPMFRHTCQTVGCATNTVNPTPTPPAVTAQCQNIKAYSTNNWTLLTPAVLSTLHAGDSVNFCVSGLTTAESFNKAKFTINGVVQAETTTKRPTSEDFCQLYVIPVATTTFNVTAQINHTTLGWK